MNQSSCISGGKPRPTLPLYLQRLTARLLLVWCTGMNKITDDQMAQAEKQIKLWESMIDSMTPKERETPELLAKTPSRRRRIARGAGRKELDVSNMIGRFTAARSMMQNMSKMMKMQGAKGELHSLKHLAPVHTGQSIETLLSHVMPSPSRPQCTHPSLPPALPPSSLPPPIIC